MEETKKRGDPGSQYRNLLEKSRRVKHRPGMFQLEQIINNNEEGSLTEYGWLLAEPAPGLFISIFNPPMTLEVASITNPRLLMRNQGSERGSDVPEHRRQEAASRRAVRALRPPCDRRGQGGLCDTTTGPAGFQAGRAGWGCRVCILAHRCCPGGLGPVPCLFCVSGSSYIT